MEQSSLEQLPDEILIDICYYLSSYEMLYSFYHINSRLNRTLTHFKHGVHLSQIPSMQFETYCQQIFPSIGYDVHSLIIHNKELAKYQIKLFTSKIELDQIFPYLEHLTLLECDCDTLILYLTKLTLLNDLIELNIEYNEIISVDMQTYLLQNIFLTQNSLIEVSLTSFHGFSLSKLSDSSTKINNLTISLKNISDMFMLFDLIPNIQHLNIHIRYNGPFSKIRCSNLTIKVPYLVDFHLKTTFEDAIQFSELQLLTDNLPTLHSLSIETYTRDLNYVKGNRWQSLLVNLTKLYKFHCSIRLRFVIDDKCIYADDVLTSFSSDFWLIEKQWYVNCYLLNDGKYGKFYLHTVPYVYETFDASIFVNNCESTYFDVNLTYPKVRQLNFDGRDEDLFKSSFYLMLNKFYNIRELKLDRLYIVSNPDDQSVSLHLLPKLIKLSLYTTTRGYINIDFLTELLLMAPNLSSLFISYTELVQLTERLEQISHTFRRIYQLEVLACREVRLNDIKLLSKIIVNLRWIKFHVKNIERTFSDGLFVCDVLNCFKSLTTLEIACHGSCTKMKALERNINSLLKDSRFFAEYDGKSLVLCVQ